MNTRVLKHFFKRLVKYQNSPSCFPGAICGETNAQFVLLSSKALAPGVCCSDAGLMGL